MLCYIFGSTTAQFFVLGTCTFGVKLLAPTSASSEMMLNLTVLPSLKSSPKNPLAKYLEVW